uniref:Putative secreted protein n=1 Tax=Anopheles darlingi TaxID=43151 RepID=A0A2M4DIZ4_ANODA
MHLSWWPPFVPFIMSSLAMRSRRCWSICFDAPANENRSSPIIGYFELAPRSDRLIGKGVATGLVDGMSRWCVWDDK